MFSLYFLYGEDNYRCLERLNQLKANFIKTYDPKGHNIFILEIDDFDTAQFKNHICQTGLFNQNKMMIIKNLLTQCSKINSEEVLKILDNNNNNISLIFYESALPDKKNKIFKKLVQLSFWNNQYNDLEYKLLPSWQVKQWFNNYLKNFGFKIENKALDYLMNICGADLWRLKNEADKMIMDKRFLVSGRSPIKKNIYIDNNEKDDNQLKFNTININLIKQLISEKLDDNIFHLTDALSKKDIKQTFSLFEQQLCSMIDPFYIFSMIVRQFRILIKIKTCQNKYSLSVLPSYIGEHPFVVSKGLNQVRYFSEKDLLNIYDKLLKMDLKMKSSNLDAKVLLEEFMLSI